jgi:hypothetical protein
MNYRPYFINGQGYAHKPLKQALSSLGGAKAGPHQAAPSTPTPLDQYPPKALLIPILCTLLKKEDLFLWTQR